MLLTATLRQKIFFFFIKSLRLVLLRYQILLFSFIHEKYEEQKNLLVLVHVNVRIGMQTLSLETMFIPLYTTIFL